jgi:hypothetical protein
VSRPSCCSLHQEEFTIGQHSWKSTIWNALFGSNTDTLGRLCDGLGSNIVVQYVSLLPFMAELLQESTWTGWVISASHDPDVISKQ